MEQKQQINPSGFNAKEKNCTLQGLLLKLNKAEPSTFGNYHVNFNEMFPKEEDYKDYFKKHVSLFNDDLVNKEKYTGTMNTSFLQPPFFNNFHENTLFYIFYYLTRDTLQLFAGVHLYKRGWKYNYKYQIWFKKSNDKEGGEKWEFFNPLEWKKKEFIYGEVDKHFLTEEEAKNLLKQFETENNKKDKKRQGQKSSSSSSQSGNNSTGGSNNHQQYPKQQQQQQQNNNNNNNNA